MFGNKNAAVIEALPPQKAPVSRRGFMGIACVGLATAFLADFPVNAYAAVIPPQTPELAALSGTTNDATAAIIAYLKTVTGKARLSGDYFIDGEVVVPEPVDKLELTPGTKIKVRGNHIGISKRGSITFRELLAAPIVAGESVLTATNASKYKVGEFITISGLDTIEDSPEKFGWMRKVTAIAGNKITVHKPFPRNITSDPRTGTVALAKTLKIEGSGEIFNTNPAASFSSLIALLAVNSPQVVGIKVHHNGATGISVGNCRGGLIDCTIYDLLDDASTHFGYGVNVTGFTNNLTVRGTISRTRHAVTTNAGALVNGLGNAGEPEDCWFEPLAIDSTDKSVDTHRAGWNNTIVPHVRGGRGGVQVRADNTHVLGGDITGTAGPGISIAPVVAVAATVDGTIVSYIKASGSALLANGPVNATNLDIIDCFGDNIVLTKNSTVTNSSIRGGGSVGVRFKGSNNSVTGLKLGKNIVTPYVEEAGAINNVFTPSAESPTLLPAPKSTKPPTVAGSYQVGQQLSITSSGAWDIAGVKFVYSWFRDGVPIGNATEREYRTYDIISTDLDKTLTVKVIARRAGYEDGSVSTAGTKVTLGNALVPTTKPTITGTPKAGQKLTANKGTWSPAAQSVGTVWLVNGVVVATGTGTYTVKSSDAGKKISARLTANRTGWASGTYTTPTVTATA